VPHDALPSIKATSSAKKQKRAEVKRRMFPTIDYSARVSHFDPRSEHHDFRGFFVLFWVALTIMVITASLRSWKENGVPLMLSQWSVLTENIYELALSDVLMGLSICLCYPLQLMYMSSNGIFRWYYGGMVFQSIFQAAWLLFWIRWPFVRTWTWTAQVFFTLHILALFMKMHSYAFYNGHLSETRRRLQALDKPETASKAAVHHYPSSTTRLQEIKQDDESDSDSQVSTETVNHLRDDLAMELVSPMGNVTYPANLTLYNSLDFLCCPTLCYELEYPRTDGIDWAELFYKTLAVFGCIFLLTITSEEFIIPVLAESSARMQATSKKSDLLLILAESISSLLFPFMVSFLLVFLVIFEYVCGAFAELTCFADRHFYSDWWNSCDWLEFSREWNIPVHHFFRRHVYSASRGHMSRELATIITFLISALAHELVMGCITKKLRGYGFFMMMMQIPIVTVQRSRLLRGRTLLNVSSFTI
jgi:sterol O-acyltransferase